jgi:hypothetical protein
MLQNRAITLLNPATWDDMNDAYYMAEFKRLKGAKTVLALCFAESRETYHHWRVFSHGVDGVCIEFDKDRLMQTFPQGPHLARDYVDYKLIKKLGAKKTIALDKLPFLKRAPFEDEREYRVVTWDNRHAAEFKDYAIKLSWIRRITLSPWMPKRLRDSVTDTLRAIDGCSRLSVTRSTLIDNETWKNFTARVETP